MYGAIKKKKIRPKKTTFWSPEFLRGYAKIVQKPKLVWAQRCFLKLIWVVSIKGGSIVFITIPNLSTAMTYNFQIIIVLLDVLSH